MANLWSRRISLMLHTRSPETWSWNPFLALTLIVPSLTSYFPVTPTFFVIHTQPPAYTLLSPPGLYSLLFPCRLPFSPSRADPSFTLPQQCSPHTHQASIVTSRLCCFCLFTYLFCQLDHEFFGGLGCVLSTSETSLSPYLAQGKWRVCDCWWLHLRRRCPFSPLSTPPRKPPALSASGGPFCLLGLCKNALLLGVSPSNTIYVSKARLHREKSRRPCPVSLPGELCYMSVQAGLVCKHTTAFWTLYLNYLDFPLSKLYLLLISLDIVCKAVLNY